MVFPHNIEGFIKSTKKSATKDKVNLLLILGGAFDVYVMYMIAPALQINYGVPKWLFFIILFILNVLVVVTVVRFFVVDEKDQLKEFENSKDDSLARYYYIREKEIPNVIDGIEIHEHVDGNTFVCLQIFNGPNDKDRAEGSYKFFCKLFTIIPNYCLDFRVYVSRERFSESEECKRFLAHKGNGENPELARAMLEIKDAVLDFTETMGQLYSTYIIIRMEPFKARTIGSLDKEVRELVQNGNHSIRNYAFLDKQRLRDFTKDYHNVEALDLSNIRNPNVSLKLMRMYGKSVYKYSKDEFNYSFYTGVKKK